MIIVLYTLATFFIAIILYPVGLVLSLSGRPEILSRLKKPSNIPPGGSIRVWIHAASVGEAGIAVAMAGEIKRTYPEAYVFISTITTTGLDRIHVMSEASGQSIVDRYFLAPFDCPAVTNKFVKLIAPTSLILVETEIWPSLIRSVHAKGIPITVINGKLSRRAFRRYMYFKDSAKKIVQNISLFCVQSRPFSRRFAMLGVPPDRIEIIGNIKFDSLPDQSNYDTASLRSAAGIPGDAKVFTAGSTRPGEEEVLAQAFKEILKKSPDAVMILAPRHLKRIPEVEKILDDNGLLFVNRTSGELLDAHGCNVLLLDTMGELISFFACSKAAFVGGSLSEYGGHNPLEPAALGVPVLFGPYMEQTGSKELLAGDAAALVHDVEELAGTVVSLLYEDDKSFQMGQAGIAVVEFFKGSLARTLLCIKKRNII